MTLKINIAQCYCACLEHQEKIAGIKKAGGIADSEKGTE